MGPLHQQKRSNWREQNKTLPYTEPPTTRCCGACAHTQTVPNTHNRSNGTLPCSQFTPTPRPPCLSAPDHRAGAPGDRIDKMLPWIHGQWHNCRGRPNGPTRLLATARGQKLVQDKTKPVPTSLLVRWQNRERVRVNVFNH